MVVGLPRVGSFPLSVEGTGRTGRGGRLAGRGKKDRGRGGRERRKERPRRKRVTGREEGGTDADLKKHRLTRTEISVEDNMQGWDTSRV